MHHRQEAAFFAVTAPGLEAVCAQELRSLGLNAVQAGAGGVDFHGRLADLYRANLWLRSASRVLVRFAEFRCRDFPRLHQKALQLPWGRFLRPGRLVELRVTCRGSRLMHTERVRQALLPAIDKVLGRSQPGSESPAQQILVRIVDDQVHLSIDSSGELLHRRGYRQMVTEAPLRETLAAGILLQLGWDGSQPLYDPMCGSGTFLIEGALLARRRAPGQNRSFAFMDWPGWRPGLWQQLRLQAQQNELSGQVAIAGSDQDAQAVHAACANARLANVARDLHIRCVAISDLPRAPATGLLLCNPPYGVRLVPEQPEIVYAHLGTALARAFPHWTRVLLCPDPELVKATGLRFRRMGAVDNGGLEVGVFVCQPE